MLACSYIANVLTTVTTACTIAWVKPLGYTHSRSCMHTGDQTSHPSAAKINVTSYTQSHGLRAYKLL